MDNRRMAWTMDSRPLWFPTHTYNLLPISTITCCHRRVSPWLGGLGRATSVKPDASDMLNHTGKYLHEGRSDLSTKTWSCLLKAILSRQNCFQFSSNHSLHSVIGSFLHTVSSQKTVDMNPMDFKEYVGMHLKSGHGASGGLQSTDDILQGKKLIGLYFSAHWCPPCRAFTPVLASLYEKCLSEMGADALEIVFISRDRSQEECSEYFESMPWTAIPYGSHEGEKLAKKFKVKGIPSLIILNGATGCLKSLRGRDDVSRFQTPSACISHWDNARDVEIPPDDTRGQNYCAIL